MVLFMANFLFFILFSCWLFLSVGCSSIADEKNRVDVAHINVKLSLLYLRQGYVANAKSKILLAWKQAPRDAEVHDAIGYFFSNTGESKIADEHYLYAIKLAKEKGRFWHNYGKFLYRQGLNQQALTYFLRAANDLNYLYVSEAYVDASFAAKKINRNDLVEKYHEAAVSHSVFVHL